MKAERALALEPVRLVAPAVEDAASRPARQRRKRSGATPLYVDGRFVGMVRYPELPPQVGMKVDELKVDGEVLYLRRFAWSELFEAHGVDLAAIEAVHFYGGRSFIQVVAGDELRRVGDRFRFSFTGGTRGKPRQRPPRDGIEYNTGIDIVRAVAVYVDRQPPTYDRGTLTFSDGRRLSTRGDDGRLVIPYSDGERHGGTRIYVDGRYVDAFRRRTLPGDAVVEGGAVDARYRLGATLERLGVDLEGARRVELWDGHDRLVRAIEGDAIAELTRMTFGLGRHSRGRIRVDALARERIASIIVHRATEPAERGLPTPERAERVSLSRGSPPRASARRVGRR